MKRAEPKSKDRRLQARGDGFGKDRVFRAGAPVGMIAKADVGLREAMRLRRRR
jgi:hypothetical protein